MGIHSTQSASASATNPVRNHGRLYVLGGVDGLQARSTRIVTDNLVNALAAAGWTCIRLALTPTRRPRTLYGRWLVEAWYRYLRYPLWCRARIPSGAMVYIVDHADAGTALFLRRGCRVIVHVHDLTSLRPPWDFPYPLRARNVLIWLLGLTFKRPGIRSADHLVAISRFTADELGRYLRVPGERITVAHNGIEQQAFCPVPRVTARRHSGLPEDVFVLMTVGPASYRKNYRVVAEALEQLGSDREPWLWLHVGALDVRTLDSLARMGKRDRLEMRSQVRLDELAMLYSAASVYVHPSLYEGFGLPPLEAMACGTPVIASLIPASMEVLGDTALWFDPDSAQQLAQRLRDVAEPTAADVAALERVARQYDWRQTAARISPVLENLKHRRARTYPSRRSA